MGIKSTFTGIFIISSMYLLFIHQFHNVAAAPGSANVDAHRPRERPFVRLTPRVSRQYTRIKSEPFNDFLVDDDDLFELSKRQTSDDYGHLRFGKREDPFDDYGHMRFGRSGNDQ